MLVQLPAEVIAQATDAVCLSQFNWMDNSKGQSPCFVAAYLESVCNNGQYTVPALLPDESYVGPDADQATPCDCSAVTYSLIAACAICQNSSNTYIAWSLWSFNCTTAYTTGFPQNIPSGTAVPNWAYLDVTTSDNFNVTLAQSVGDAPESTAAQVKPTSSATLTSGTSSPTPTSSKSSDVATIAGGVVGGVVGLAAIVALGTWFLLRRRRTSMFPARPVSQYSSSTVDPMRRLYDPSDPSTFPSNLPVNSGSSFPSRNPGLPYNRSEDHHPSAYRGAPEI